MSTAAPQGPAASSLRKREEDPSVQPEAPPEESETPTCTACAAELDPAHLYCSSCGWSVNETRAFDVTDDELEHFLFHGFVARKFEFFAGRVYVEIRTLQAGDYNKITRHMGGYAGGRRSIQADYANEERLTTLSHALVTWMGREVKDVDTARAALEAIGEGLMELIQDRFNRLVLGIDKEIKKELRVKNS
jgi:hypothetical protein